MGELERLCSNCKHLETEVVDEPCRSCAGWFLSNFEPSEEHLEDDRK